MAEYNKRGNPVANTIYDKLLKPEEEPSYDGVIPEKPAGLNELPPNINMSAAPIKNLSELNKKTPQEQYEHDVQMKNPASAYTRKEKKELENLVEAAKDKGVLKDDADLASQTPAGEASTGDILPGNDYINPAETSNNTDVSNNTGDTSSTSTGNTESTDTTNGANDSSSGDGKPKDTKAKQESKYKLRSIMDAYNEGLLDENSRDYLIVDALSKFARNTGKDLGNLAAAYTGGSVNNDKESGIWEERNKAMAEKGIGAEGNQYRAGDQYDLGYQSQEAALEAQRLANAKERIKMVPAQNFQKAAEELRRSGNNTAAGFMDLIAAASTQRVDPEEYIAMAYANDPNARKLVNEVLKAGSTAAGSLSDIMESLNGIGSDMRELTAGLKKKFNL